MTNFAPAVRVTVRCHYCSKFYPLRELMTIGVSVHICPNCRAWHKAAMDDFCRNPPPPACQECGKPWINDQASKTEPGSGDIRMVMVPKDGTYQVICKPCADAYEAKRRDLFRHTEYQHRKGLY